MPILFSHDDNGQLTFIQKLDVPGKKEESGTMSAMAKFRTLDKRGQGSDEAGGMASVKTTHKNAIK